MASYSYWYTIATSSGASGLAAITDASSNSDPLGTDCDSSYWEAKAYDQIRALYAALGSSPGTGADGNWVINQDASSNVNSYIYFSTGNTIPYGEPSIYWSATQSAIRLNKDTIFDGNIGASGSRVTMLYASTVNTATITASGLSSLDDVNIGGDLDVTGTITFGTLSMSGSLSTDGTQLILNNGNAGADATLEVDRGVGTSASILWDESETEWAVYNLALGSPAYNYLVLYDASGVTTADVFAGSGGLYGTATKIARSDHSHSGGTLAATGTEETTWTIDDDYTSGSVDIEVRFAGSSNYIRYNPSSSYFLFSDDIHAPNVETTADVTVGGDLVLTGSITGDLSIDGTVFTLNYDLGAGAAPSENLIIRTNRGSSTDTELRWNETNDKWEFTNDGTNFYNVVGSAVSGSATSLPGDLTVAGNWVGDIRATGDEVWVNYNAVSGADGLFSAFGPSGSTKSLKWNNASSVWQFQDSGGTYRNMVGSSGTQTVSDKTLTSVFITTPAITDGGTWTGNPIFGGNPVFSGSPSFTSTPSFSGAATFTGGPVFNCNSATPSFTKSSAPGAAPFTVSSHLSTTVTNLSADLLDGKHGSQYISHNGTSFVLTDDLNCTGFTLIGYTVAATAHQSQHMAGGADALVGYMGSVAGTYNPAWTVNADDATAGTLYLGSGTSYSLAFDTSTAAGMLLAGGADIDLTPGSASNNQDLGNSASGRRWRNALLLGHLNFNQVASTGDLSGLANGSIWSQSGTPQTFKVRLNSTDLTVIDSNNKVAASGTTSATFGINGNEVWTAANLIIGTHVQAFNTNLANLAAYGYTGGGSSLFVRAASPTFSGDIIFGTGNLKIDAGKNINFNGSSSLVGLYYTAVGQGLTFYNAGTCATLTSSYLAIQTVDIGLYANRKIVYDVDVSAHDYTYSDGTSVYNYTGGNLIYSTSGSAFSVYKDAAFSSGISVSSGNIALTNDNYDLQLAEGCSLDLNGSSSSKYGFRLSGGYIFMTVNSFDKVWLNADYLFAAGVHIAMATNKRFYYDLDTGYHDYTYSDGTYIYTYVGGFVNMALDATTTWMYRNVRIDQNNKLYLDWDSNTYIFYNGTNVLLYKNGAQVASW